MGVAALSSTTIREAVADLLGVPPTDVDPDADLIGQGLDSIRMMSLAGRWRKLGVDVDFASLAASPSVRAWSDLVATVDGGPSGAASPADSSAITDAAAAEPFPLAPMQHAMWVGRGGDQRLGGVAGHLYVEFDGPALDPAALVRAATALSARHPMLRVRFLPDGTQRIGTVPHVFPVEIADYREWAEADVSSRLTRVRGDKSHQQLDGTVFELTMSQLPGDRTRLHVDLDMQAADAMSYRILMADLAHLYQGVELSPLGYTYRQYRLAADHEATGSPARAADYQWWNGRIPELPDAPQLPLVAPDAGTDPRHTTRRSHWLDPATRDALFTAARRRGITPAMALAASFADALAGWSAERRFLLNLPMFGRDQYHPDVDRLVGDFTSSLLLDVDLSDQRTATARSRAVQTALHSVAAHASYPGLAVLRDLARHRGAQVLAPVVYTSALGLGELFAPVVNEAFGTAVWINSQGPQVLLDAQVTEFDGGVLVNWDVREHAFPPGVIDAMFDRHVTELHRLAADDDAWDGEPAPLLTGEQWAVRRSVDGGAAPASGDNLLDGFVRNAERTPDAVAVIASTGTLSYAQLREKVSAIAAALQSRGVSCGDVVAVMGPKNADQIPALLGILTAGAAYLPIGIDQPAERAARILDTGGVEFALVTGTELPDVPLPALTVHDAEIIGDPAHFETTAVDAGDLAYVLFTSGSTGEPKGVELTHDAVLNTLEFLYRHFDIGPNDRALALSHLESDMSVPDVFGTLRAGGAIVVVDEEHRRDPDAWARLIEQHEVSVVNFLPGWLDMLVEVGGPPGRSLESLRVVLTGGDWVRPELVRSVRRLSPHVRFAGLGGATETAVHGTIYEVGPDLDADAPMRWASIPYGVPFPNNTCRVVGADGRDCPDWVAGELWFAGRGIARGYRARPELTAERFVEHDGRIWYRSGDLARYWPDGTLEFVGRADHRVKISGYRIELGEVEAALRRVSGVGAAVATVVPDGAGRDVLGAMIRLDDRAVDTDTVLAALPELVPAHMIPTIVLTAETIPVRNGKTDRTAVAARLGEVGPSRRRGHRAPDTNLEAALAHILGEVLGRDDVGVDDDFFSLGGDSVMATTAVARVRDWLDTPTVLVPDIFAARTVARLAQLLSAREPGSDRLDQVAELYLEVSDMDGVEVASELERVSTPSP